MSANTPNNSITITVESENGQLVQVELNSCMRNRCPAISAILPRTILPGVQAEPFRAVTSYLDGDQSLSVFANHINSDTFLLLFAQTWALAAQLGLPALQNELISIMASVHAKIVDGGDTGSRLQYTADGSLIRAFQHLRDRVGRNSHAENFLICFAGRTAPLICELERTLNTKNMDRVLRDAILAQARSFRPDPIKHQPRLVLVDLQKPPRYPPLEMHRNDMRVADESCSTSEPSNSSIGDDAGTRQLPFSYGGFTSTMRKPSQKLFIPRTPQRCRSPKPTYPPARSPLPDWFDDDFNANVRMQPGDPDDPSPWCPSQTVAFDDPTPSPIDPIGVIHVQGRGSELSPLLPLLPPSSPLAGLSPPLPSPPRSPCFGRCHHHNTEPPYIIQVLQHNNSTNVHGNANRVHNNDNNIAIAQAQGGSRSENSTARAVATGS